LFNEIFNHKSLLKSSKPIELLHLTAEVITHLKMSRKFLKGLITLILKWFPHIGNPFNVRNSFDQL
jgi:hypothetical protein